MSFNSKDLIIPLMSTLHVHDRPLTPNPFEISLLAFRLRVALVGTSFRCEYIYLWAGCERFRHHTFVSAPDHGVSSSNAV